jgi:hypothetical protein
VLAIKLHKTKKPWLGRGSYLVPVTDWRTGRVHIKHWIRLLNRFNAGSTNDAIRFITLVRIPDSHPVLLFADCFEKYAMAWMGCRVVPEPLSAQMMLVQRLLMLWPADRIDEAPSPALLRSFSFRQVGEARRMSPELILAKRLPPSATLWTKRVQLLYGKPKRKGDS